MLFLAQFRKWTWDMGRIAVRCGPGTGACTLAAAMDLWSWTLHPLQHATDADGEPLYRDKRQGATFPLADALCWLLASYYQILDVLELESRGAEDPRSGRTWPGYLQFFTDLCHVQAARAAGEVARICSELVFGYNRHPSWDPDCGSCMGAGELDGLEGLMPGISVGIRLAGEVVEEDGSHCPRPAPASGSRDCATFPSAAANSTAASPAPAWPKTAPARPLHACPSPIGWIIPSNRHHPARSVEPFEVPNQSATTELARWGDDW